MIINLKIENYEEDFTICYSVIILALPTAVDAKIKGYYQVSLEAVDIENTTKGTISNPENSAGFTIPTYCDSLVNIVFSFEPTHIDFSIKNESKSNIKIVWDDVIYMGGIQGNSVGVFHSGVKYNDRREYANTNDDHKRVKNI